MVAGAAMMQSMRDCTASRTNCCIWGSQAEIMHILLEWIMNLERESGGKTVSTCDYARQLLLEWMQPITEKQKQLVACLTLFELLQRHRSKLQTFEAREENVCLLGDQVEVYMDAIRDIVERGTTRVDLHRVKPSKLALIALETLILLSGDVAAQYLISNEVAKTRLVDDKLMHKVVETMRFCLMTLRQWHLHSTRRQLLGYAIQHLLAYVTACDVVLPSKNRNGDGNTGVDNQTVLDVLCWHWETTAPVLCTRSVAFSRVQKHQPSKVLARVLERWATDTYATRDKPGIVNPEVVNAQLRYVCLLMDSIGGVKGCSKAFGDFSAEMKANFVFFFVHGLTTAVKNGNYTTVLLVLEVLRTLLLPSDSLSLLDSRDEEQGLLSQLLRSHGRSTVTRVVSDIGSEAQTELELFVADFIISRGLLITELVCRVDGTHTANVMVSGRCWCTIVFLCANTCFVVVFLLHRMQFHSCGHFYTNSTMQLINHRCIDTGGKDFSRRIYLIQTTERNSFFGREQQAAYAGRIVSHHSRKLQCAATGKSSRLHEINKREN
ncbi:Histone acetyltransferase ESA1 [Phytophthora nicotianae]|nr:Histone acetyltransferase ESA1 [Phytophthora nicotianae]